jgi:hypothetical protein
MEPPANPPEHRSPADPAPDGRRSSRINTCLWVRVGGLDTTARSRRGNISLTGLYVALDVPVGSPGDVVRLSNSSADKRCSARVMARVTRVVRQDDIHRGAAVIGAAFEFLPANQPQRAIVDLVRHVTSLELANMGSVSMDRRLPAYVERGSGTVHAGRVEKLATDRLVLHLGVEPGPGERLKVTLPEPGGGTVKLQGEVVVAQPGAEGGFSVVVRFSAPKDESAGASDGEYQHVTVAALLNNLLVPSKIPPRKQRHMDLSGQLSRVQLPSLLALVEMERLTGLITIANDRAAVRIYIREGRVIDAEQDGSSASPRDVLGSLLEWQDAEFSVVCVPVQRRARVDMPTTALLLDLVRERDERVA